MTFDDWWKENRNNVTWWAEGLKGNMRMIWEAATAAERERCAKVCDAIAGAYRDHSDQFRRGAGRCAADIRAANAELSGPQRPQEETRNAET